VAGRWYPDDPARLAADVDRFLSSADVPRLPAPRAIVAPHAGLMYSGPVGAYAYKAVKDHPPDAIVMVGPSHFVPFDGVSIWPEGAWATPFGLVQVDTALASALAAAKGVMTDFPEAHRREHSLEMQLTFIAHLMAGVPIVPMVMGEQTRETAFLAGELIAGAIADSGRRVLLVASSDLSHYEPADTAARLDDVVMSHVQRLDDQGLMNALESNPRHACGGGPMVAVLHAVRQLGASDAAVLRYADSGDVSGDKSSVVGYMAAAIW